MFEFNQAQIEQAGKQTLLQAELDKTGLKIAQTQKAIISATKSLNLELISLNLSELIQAVQARENILIHADNSGIRLNLKEFKNV